MCYNVFSKNSGLKRALIATFALCYWDLQGRVGEDRLLVVEAGIDWLNLLGVCPEEEGSSVYLDPTWETDEIHYVSGIVSGHVSGIHDTGSREYKLTSVG